MNRALPGLACGLLSLLLGAAPAHAVTVTCSGGGLTYDDLSDDTDSFPLCGLWGRCQPPVGFVIGYLFTTPGCDPNATTCAMTATVSAEFPGNHQNDPSASGNLYSFAQVDLFGPANNLLSRCGASGAVIRRDLGLATVAAGVTCANPSAARLTLTLTSCPACPVCPFGGPPESCIKSTSIPLDFAGADAANCPQPPVEDCQSCGGCAASAGGGAPGCASPLSGNGVVCNPESSGPGAHLRYRAGGAGGAGLPGSAGWTPTLGLYWSHDYAQRIAPAPDVNHVYLITERASFREFSHLATGSGLRLYQANAPSDEYRRLYHDTATGGWQLDHRDGRRDFFLADGRWEKTVLSQNPTHPTVATYGGGNQLVSVSFPDGRSETFTYHPSGKLASLTEVPVAGSGTPSRTWNYLWSGDELTTIGRPDRTSWEFTYDPAKNGGRPGFVTQIRLIGSDGVTGRVEAAFEYDGFGNVIQSWRGDPSFSGPNAVNRQELTYTNPQFPTRTEVREWIDGTRSEVTVYEFDRDPRSLKARVNRITGDCPVCGTGPNSQFTYADNANPLRPTQIVDGRGLRTQYSYNADGEMTSKTEAVGTPLARTTTWQYGNASFPALPTRIEMPSTSGGSAMRVTVLAYDGGGNPTTRTLQGAESGGSFSHTTTSIFNASGQPLTVDPPGYGAADQTLHTYDSARGDLVPLTRTDPLIGAATFGHDGFNRQTSMTDPNAVETVTAYDDLNRVTAVTQKGAAPVEDLTTTYQYNVFGDLFRTVLPRGNVIEYGYDFAGRLVSVERKPDPATPGERTVYTLDVFGHRTKEEFQRWNGSAWVTDSFTSYTYSSRCHLDKTVYADGTATEYSYDCDGNLEKVWDAKHPKATNPTPTQLYAYDSLNRLTSVTQPWTGAGGGTAVTTYGYDVQDHLTRVTDAEGNTTAYTYSDRDLMTQEVSPVSGMTVHSYNEHGELVSETDARGITMTRTVDALDRVTLMNFPDDALDTAYTYDEPGVAFSKGRLTRIARNGTNIDYRYDRFGRVLQDGELSYRYDANSNPVSLVYPGGVEAVSTYDFSDRPASLLARRSGQPDQPLVNSAVYRAFGPVSSLSLGNGLTETRAFNQRYFPSSITLAGRLDWTYTTDPIGNILTITDALNAGNNRTYGYQDVHYFLTQGNGPWGRRSWTYDKIGNRLTETRGAVTDTYSYLPSTGGGRSPILSQIQLGAGGTRAYQFGPAGHLEATAAGSDVTFFDTDAAGRLFNLERTLPPLGVGFLYDGRGYLTFADSKVLPFADGFESGTTCFWTATSGLAPPAPVCPPPQPTVKPTYSSEGLLHALTRNVAPQRSLVFQFAGRPVAQLDLTGGAESWKYLTTDHLGTPIAATNPSGSLLWQGGFEPFGADWSGAAGAGVFLRFPGQWEDAAWASAGVEIYENVHRYYVPETGQYTQPDPLGLPSQLNPFAYADARPSVLVDPTGLRPTRPTDSQCCARAEQQGLFSAPPAPVGAVICCQGRRVACLPRPLVGLSSQRSAAIRQKCILRHEAQHFPDVDCDPGCLVSRPPFRSPTLGQESECRGYREEIRCLIQLKPQCGQDQGCLADIEQGIESSRILGSFYGGPRCNI